MNEVHPEFIEGWQKGTLMKLWKWLIAIIVLTMLGLAVYTVIDNQRIKNLQTANNSRSWMEKTFGK